ncbi:dihydropyrimidine dehydrogenase [NADP(+)] isoform X1 [Misgurnus anguillicaudatus]|uniref:dihydropyrimidine dehydrogenase [NADP(+)] isoform X1 n=1 Tax=Misgurnus anguillicaudatus TaxID=75329 RepID=UPI003CCF19F6
MVFACGQDPELVPNICRWVRQAVRVPFFAKLAPNVTDIVDVAKAAQEEILAGPQVLASRFFWNLASLPPLSPCLMSHPCWRRWSRWSHSHRHRFGADGTQGRRLSLAWHRPRKAHHIWRSVWKCDSPKSITTTVKALPVFPILATGGIDFAESGL